MSSVPEACHEICIEGETADIRTAAELAVALDVLQGAHDRAVLEQLKPHLARIIATDRGLQNILKSLATADQLYLINTLGDQLALLISDAALLRDILAMLAESTVEEALLNRIGSDRLRELAATPADLADMLEWVYGDGDELLLTLLGNRCLAALFTNGSELGQVLAMLSRPLQHSLIQELGWEQVAALIHSRDDIRALLAVVSAETSAALIAHLSPTQLRRLIPNQRAWQELVTSLEQREIRLLRTRLEVPYAQ